MRITSIDIAQFLALIVALALASLGLVSWYVVLLFVLFSFHLSLDIPLR